MTGTAPTATTAAGPAEPPFWASALDAALARLDSGPAGLSQVEAARRLARVGANRIDETRAAGPLRLLLRQVESPLVLILVFGVGLSLLLGEWTDAAIIIAIIIGSALLGFAQEYRASRALEELRSRLAPTARVLRDGVVMTVPTAQLVPGDIVEFAAGHLVSIDGLIVEARDFLVSEASLTGESFPVEKRTGVVKADASLAERTNAVFAGSTVRSGTARVLVFATGSRTVYGAIAGRLGVDQPETEFARGIRQFGGMLMRVMFVIVLFVLAINQLLGRPLPDSLLFAVALAVGLSPELLPAIVSVTLAAGARRLAAGGALVRHLEAIENLGSIDVLCTDKTGTLTEGRVVFAGAENPTGQSSADVSRLAFLNATFETGIENPLDAAIIAAGAAAGLTADGFRKIDEIPYDFIRRRLTVVVAEATDAATHLMIVKGAFAEVLGICDRIATDAGPQPLDARWRAALEVRFQAKGDAGFRTLALAERRLPAQAAYGHADEDKLVLRGLLLFLDPPKPDAAATIQSLAALGIATKVITGDNRHVARHLASAIGLDPAAMLTGTEIAEMTDPALWDLVPRTQLFAEIDPQQKEKIVRALQHCGHAVGYLGDGINDAPALHAADVGISVEHAVDVARESADLVLLEPDLGILRQAVVDGRRSFVNTLKYIAITTSANFGNMVSMAVAAPLLPFLPLLPKQILLNNFLSDLPSMAISIDNVDEERLAQPQRWSIADVRRFMIVFGLVSSLFDLVTFAVLLNLFAAAEAEFQTGWFIVSLLTELAVVMVLRTTRPAWRSRPGRLLFLGTAVVLAVTIALPYLPLGPAFGLVGLRPVELAVVIAIAIAYIVATEIAKRLFYRTRRQ